MTVESIRRALAASAETGAARYRSLFEAMDEGFCIIDVLWDADGEPVDYRFLEVNPAFLRHTGLADAVGRTIRDLVPDHDAHWFAAFGRVARTGEPVRFEDDATAMGRAFDVYAFPVDGADGLVAVLFTDVSERRRRERHLTFLTAVVDEVDRLAGADEIVRTAGARLGGFLGCDRCDVCEIDEAADDVRIVTAWTA
ncbi:MAG TPA: PAS domain-containing protein, partial [Miltoncostaea sp.]|nr:PAS domain-containing protein [Miltoncostaea sp.]